jgi:hypothetical protein
VTQATGVLSNFLDYVSNPSNKWGAKQLRTKLKAKSSKEGYRGQKGHVQNLFGNFTAAWIFKYTIKQIEVSRDRSCDTLNTCHFKCFRFGPPFSNNTTNACLQPHFPF